MRASLAEVRPSPAAAQDRPTTIPAIGADGSLFPIEKLRAHQDGTRHLAVSVFVFAGDELLIQRRAAAKYHSALQWANTCCSHPHWGESLADAAHRRLREELGIDLPLTPCAELTYRAEVAGGLVEHELVHIFRGDCDRATLTIRPDPAEVSATCWMGLGALRKAMAGAPHDYAPWFRIYLDRWTELRL